MAIYRDKNQNVEIEVKDYSFESFEHSGKVDNVARAFEFQDLSGVKSIQRPEHQKIIKNERTAAKKNSFKISPMVLEHRGISAQEAQEKEDEINQLVEQRFLALKEKAFEEGFEEGKRIGQEQVMNEMRIEVDDKIGHLSKMIENVLITEHEILEKNKKDIYQLVRNLTKWVILKEVKDDERYLARLLEKLVLEINTKSNLLIKVGKQSFDKMPEVLDQVQENLGQFKNVRVEVDYELDDRGIILESNNGIINASMKEQLNSINRLFESLGIDPEVEDE